MASKGSSDYQAAVRLIDETSVHRKAGGLKPLTKEQKHFAVAWFLTGFRAAKKQQRKGSDDDE